MYVIYLFNVAHEEEEEGQRALRVLLHLKSPFGSGSEGPAAQGGGVGRRSLGQRLLCAQLLIGGFVQVTPEGETER